LAEERARLFGRGNNALSVGVLRRTEQFVFARVLYNGAFVKH
jgi:hypothetical protein